MLKIRLSRKQVGAALDNYVRSKGYITGQGVILEKKETMNDSWYEAWAWVTKDEGPEEVEESK